MGPRASTIAAVLALAASPAVAQDVETFDAPVGVGHLFTAAGADTTPAGRVSTGVWLTYADDALVTRNADDEVTGRIIEQMTTVHLLGAYGITDAFEVGVALPLSFVEGPQLGIIGGPSGGGAGDFRFTGRYRLIGTPAAEGFRLAASFDVTLPTGDGERGLGSKSATYTPAVAADLALGIVRVVADLGFRIRTEDEKLANVEIGNEVRYALGAEIAFGTSPFSALVEGGGVAPASSVEDFASSAPVELLAGLRARTVDGHAATIGAGYGIIAGYGAPAGRLMVGYSYSPADDTCQVCGAPPPADSDGDGLSDAIDRCPLAPEDKDGFEDGDGCPDPDNDADGIPDAADQCPMQAEDKDGDRDEDGCPEETAPGDRDGDGIFDAADRCPDELEDKDGFGDEDGCPDLDNDRDGILDVDDKCPLEQEVKNGFEDTDGCPDEKPNVQVGCTNIELGDNVFFETGKHALAQRSYPLLDDIARTLVDNPWIRKVRIEGHTDNEGGAAFNDKLSTQRVWVVRQYLADRGVSKARMAYRGFGQAKPIAPNDTEEGRAKNRRVEIAIVEADARQGCE